jgi:hypothetical protein
LRRLLEKPLRDLLLAFPSEETTIRCRNIVVKTALNLPAFDVSQVVASFVGLGLESKFLEQRQSSTKKILSLFKLIITRLNTAKTK